MLMCCELSTKILRKDTVLDQLKLAFGQDRANFQNIATRLLLGNIVITQYNKKTYRIDDILWNAKPSDTFDVSVLDLIIRPQLIFLPFTVESKTVVALK